MKREAFGSQREIIRTLIKFSSALGQEEVSKIGLTILTYQFTPTGMATVKREQQVLMITWTMVTFIHHW